MKNYSLRFVWIFVGLCHVLLPSSNAAAGPAPSLSAISPTSGSVDGGNTVTLSGNKFSAGVKVTFGGVAATDIVVVSQKTIRASAPAHAAGMVAVKVTNANGKSTTLANSYTYVANGTNPDPTPSPTVTPSPTPLRQTRRPRVCRRGFLTTRILVTWEALEFLPARTPALPPITICMG
jgi:hypothetical protein